MHRTPHLLILFAAVALFAAVLPQDPPAQDPPAPRPRVIIHVTDNVLKQGYVEREDDELIVIRTADGVESFIKGRLVRIIRLVDPRPGQTGVVVLRDGRYFEGTIIEDVWSHVTVEIEGIRLKYEREIIHHVILRASFEEIYEELRRVIPADQHIRRFELAQWLFGRRAYQFAERELEIILTQKPDFPEAVELLRLVRAQLVLETRQPAPLEGMPGRGSGTAPDNRGDGPADQRDLLPSQLLTPEDVNIIRVYEIDFDRPPRVRVSPDVIRELIANYAHHPVIPANSAERTALFREDPLVLTRKIMEARARELYPKIEVLSEPYALNIFRQRVHNTWLINNCATSRCHGGVKSGRLFLHRRGYRDDRVRYTNLLILERTDLGGEWPLINYDQPTMSLIIQHGLPRTEARLPHPDVPGWTPVFNRSNQRLLEDSLLWIRSMYQPRPEYPIEYEPPQLGIEAPDDRPGIGPERVPR